MSTKSDLLAQIQNEVMTIHKRYQALEGVLENPDLYPLSFLKKAADNLACSFAKGYKAVMAEASYDPVEDVVVAAILDDPSVCQMFIALRIAIINLERTNAVSRSDIKNFIDILI